MQLNYVFLIVKLIKKLKYFGVSVCLFVYLLFCALNFIDQMFTIAFI